MTPVEEARVLLVMRRAGNARVVQQAMAELGLNGVSVSNESELAGALADAAPPRSAVVDVSGFGSTAWRMCDTLHQRGVPFVVLSAARDAGAGSLSLAHGATSVLHKPVAKSALLQLVRSLGGDEA